jgi:hypothetical protein
MADPKQRTHYWMTTALITYDLDGEVTQSYMNSIVDTPFRAVSQSVLSKVTSSMLKRLAGDHDRDMAGKIKGHTFMNVTWLGHMTESEFHDMDALGPNSAKH